MRIVRVNIENFRSIKNLEFFPQQHNVFIGPNNIGKTAIVEAINLCLNPELSYKSDAVDENDFFNRQYLIKKIVKVTDTETKEEISYPKIKIEVILGPVLDEEELIELRSQLIAWNPRDKKIAVASEEVEDPFHGNETAIRICFEAQFDHKEDEFVWNCFYKKDELSTWNLDSENDLKLVSREAKRRIGFLIYRDVRALQRPITLDPQSLLVKLAQSQDAHPKNFEGAFQSSLGSLDVLSNDTEFGRVLNEIKIELNKYLQHGISSNTVLKTELTDRTRSQFKTNAQLYLDDKVSLPIQKYGAGTRSLFNLGFLTYIMGKRGRGILSLEEPETFLYPHAQRRVISEAKKISNQLFVTTHSPYVLEQFSSDNLARVIRDDSGNVQIKYLDQVNQKFFKRHVRKQMSEALLSNFVVITEEDSMAKWLLGCSEILHSTMIEDCIIESFDLAGVTVLSANGNGGVVAIAEFLESAGIPVLICVDESKTVENLQRWKDANKPCFTLPYTGLESLIVAEFSSDKIKQFVCDCEVQGVSALSKEKLEQDPKNFQRTAFEFFQRNKGSLPLHDFFIGETNSDEVPETIKKILMSTVRTFKPNRPENAENQL